MIIYKITNKINGKIYIGQTTNTLKKRWSQHKSDKKGYCKLLFFALNKYGENSFSVETLDYAENIEELNDKEKYYIEYLNTLAPNGYNLLTGGNNRTHHEISKRKMSESRKGVDNPMYGKTHDTEARKKISDAQKGNKNCLGIKRSQETKDKLSIARTGTKTSEETKIKLSNAMSGEKHPNWGKKLSEETIRKKSEAMKGTRTGSQNTFFGKIHTKEAKKKMGDANRGRPSAQAKKVLLVELNKIFKSLWVAAIFCRENGVPTKPQTISKACKDKNKIAAGYHWEFV